MSQPCEQAQIISQMMQILGALKDLPDAIKDMRKDFQRMYDKVSEASEEGATARAQIANNSASILELKETNLMQWKALEAQANRMTMALDQINNRAMEHGTREGSRIEELERWRAVMNNGTEGGASARLKNLEAKHQQEEGQKQLFLYVPIVCAVISAASVLYHLFKAGAP